jgi:xylan 1,4-beta-xylosidase
LSAVRKTNDVTAAVLARATAIGDYTAETVVDCRELSDDVLAGLSAFGDRANSVGLAVGNGKLLLWRRDKGRHQQLAEAPAPKSERLHLRLVAAAGHQFRFSSSPDGRSWKPIGDDLEGRHLPPWDRNVRVALTVGGAENASASFESFRMTPTSAR